MKDAISVTASDPAGAIEIDRLLACVESRLNGRVRGLLLFIRGHGLVLQGHSTTYHAKQLAQHAVMNETTLPIVSNEIEVG